MPSELERVMRERRSVRSFTSEAPPDEAIERVLAAAITAPSASNKQPWRFFVVANRARIDAMAEAVKRAVERIAAHIPAESEAAFRRYGEYFVRFAAAPRVIVPIHRPQRLLSQLVDAGIDAELRDRISAMESDSGLVSTSLALMNLLLAAHATGLGASVMTGPLVAVDELEPILGVPPGWSLVALVPIGYPAEQPASPGRKPLDKAIRWLR